MKKYRVVFTHVRRMVDLVGEVTEDNLVTHVQNMLGNGWMLSELTAIA